MPAGAVESGVVYIAPVEPYGAVVQVFLDIDGVLLGLDRERPHRLALADHALDFLSFLLARATVHWLSPGHREAKAAVDHLLVHTRQSERERLLTLAPRVRTASWRTLRTEALPSDGRFLWLDDAPSPDELAALRQRGGSIAGSGSTPATSPRICCARSACSRPGCCGAARMVDTAAWLCDAVIPEVPVWQWVLSLPFRGGVAAAGVRGRAQATGWWDRVPGGPGQQLETSTPRRVMV